jgi:hypothetical protein
MQSNFDPYIYIYTVLQYAKMDLTFQNHLQKNRSVFPLTEDEQKHFSDMLYHIDRAMLVLETLPEFSAATRKSLFNRIFLKIKSYVSRKKKN